MVLEVRMTPGLTDPTIKREYSMVWRGGQKEKLPFLLRICPDETHRTEEKNGNVYLITTRGLAVRRGSKTRAQSPWQIWGIQPSDELYSFMQSYAESKGAEAISRTAYTCAKRLAPGIVHGTEVETNSTNRFVGTRFAISPTRHPGWWLPHRVESVDFTSYDVVYRSKEGIQSMPEYLVFTGASDLKHFAFNQTKTEKILQQIGAR